MLQMLHFNNKMLQTIRSVIRSDNLPEVKLQMYSVCKIYYDELLMIAVESSAIKTLNYLLNDVKIDPNIRDGEAILSACSIGNISSLRLLISFGADPAIRNNQALLFTIYYGRRELMNELLKYPTVNIFANDNQAIITAAMRGYYDIFLQLLAMGADVSAQNNKVLISAAGAGHYPIVKILVYHININVADKNIISWCKITEERKMARYFLSFFPDD